jgi:hypothetical protein
MGDLMWHYERGECPNMTIAQIHARREEKLQFHNALLARQEGFDPRAALRAADATSGNCGTQASTSQILAMHGTTKVRSTGASHPNMVPFAHGYGIKLASAGKENARTAAGQELLGFGGNVADENDPDSFLFDVKRYYTAGTYKCPHYRCQ